MIRIHMGINTGFAGVTHTDYVDYEEDYWNALSEDEQQAIMEQDCRDYLMNKVEVYVSKVEIV